MSGEFEEITGQQNFQTQSDSENLQRVVRSLVGILK